jgi:lipooligosaccharide transport system permease protein
MASPPAIRATRYFALAYRRTWRASIMGSFVSPVLYLAAIGVGLGSFVHHHGAPASLGHLSYLHFVAPALAATAAATVAAEESMFPVMGAIKWNRTYFAMLATPLRVGDVLAGHLVWIATRVAMAVSAFLAVMAVFGSTTSWTAVAVLPVGVLTGFAFAAPLVAFAATQDNDSAFSLVFRLGMVPLFLFSGVFFPVSQLPQGLRAVAYATPLYHGVELCRALAIGSAQPGSALFHCAYLAALGAAGTFVALRTYRRRLVQ